MARFANGLLILLTIGLTGCALQVQVGGFSSANLDASQRLVEVGQMQEKFQELQQNNIVPSNVLISDITLPTGLKLNGDQMVVAQGSKHKVLGYFFVNKAPNLALNNVDAFKLIKQAAGAMGADFVYLVLQSENVTRAHYNSGGLDSGPSKQYYNETLYYSKAWAVKLDPQVAKKLKAKK